MKAKLRSKFVLIGILSIIVMALIGVFAVPAIVSAAKGPAPAAAIYPNRNFSRVQGIVDTIDPSNNQITIKPNGTGSPITLTFDKNTNFAIHGNSWLDPSSMAGETVSAVYNNNNVAIQIAINMPAPPPMPPKPPENKNISMVQGTLTLNPDGTITIAPTNGNSVGPLTWNESSHITLQGATLSQPAAGSLTATTPLKGPFTGIYNNKNQLIGLLMGNMPAPPPMPPRPLINKNILMVTGNLTIDSSGGPNAKISITPGHGKSDVGPLTWNETSRITLQGAALSQSTDGLNLIVTASLTRPVCVVYDKSNIVEQIIVNMPRLVPGVIKPPAIFGGGGMPPKVQPPRWSLPQGKFR